MNQTDKQIEGTQGEKLAAKYLTRQGLKLIEKNYRCRFGEIDLIFNQGRCLIFVEVRVRSNPNFGGAASSIDQRKQEKLIRTAKYYLSQSGDKQELPCRFDVVLLNHRSEIEWIKNAFSE